MRKFVFFIFGFRLKNNLNFFPTKNHPNAVVSIAQMKSHNNRFHCIFCPSMINSSVTTTTTTPTTTTTTTTTTTIIMCLSIGELFESEKLKKNNDKLNNVLSNKNSCYIFYL